MNTRDTSPAVDTVSTECCAAPRSFWSRPRILAVAGTAALGGGAWLGWDWLVALGVAPILIAVGPCLLMCGAGLCVGKLFGAHR